MKNNLKQFDKQPYLNLETYRKNGTPMLTPVWFVQDGDSLYVRTIANSGKVKRMRNNASVRVMACGQQGEPLGEWVAAQAREITDGMTYEKIGNLIYAKYGEMAKTFEARTLASGQKYTVIKIVVA